jgi:hypothetical protein
MTYVNIIHFMHEKIIFIIRKVCLGVAIVCEYFIEMPSSSSMMLLDKKCNHLNCVGKRKKSNHKSDIINNAGYLGVDFDTGSCADIRRFLTNGIRIPYKYILFPIRDQVFAWRYLSRNYTNSNGMYVNIVGGYIYTDQRKIKCQRYKALKGGYSDAITILPNELTSHQLFYQNIWKQNESVWFAPIRHCFVPDETTCVHLDFTNLSHLMLYLSKYEYYIKLLNEHKEKIHSTNLHCFHVPIELFMSDTFSVNITPFCKYSELSNISIDSSPKAPWTLKTLSWFYLKNYYAYETSSSNTLKNVLPTRFFNQLQCIEFNNFNYIPVKRRDG